MKYFFLIVIFIFSQLSLAGVSVTDIELRYKINTLMIHAQEQILETFKDHDEVSIRSVDFQNSWEKKVRSLTENLVLDQLKLAKANPNQITYTKKILSSMKWKTISHFMLNQVKKLRVLSRVNGLGLVMFCVFTNVAQVVIPSILTSVGLPVLAVITVVATGNVPTILYFKGATYFSKLKRAHKNFKGEKNYKKYTKILKEVKSKLNGAELSDLVVRFGEMSDSQGIIVKKEGLVRKALIQLGFLEDSITMKSLEGFLKTENIVDPVLEGILRNQGMESDVRLALSLNYMDANLEAPLLMKYKTKFQKSFIPIHTAGHEQIGYEWVQLVLKSRTMSDFDQAFMRISPEMHPMEVYLLWEQIVLPHFSKDSSTISYYQFRKLTYGAESLKADIFLNERSSMNASNRAIFSKYFTNSMKLNSKNCFKSHDQILSTLFQ